MIISSRALELMSRQFQCAMAVQSGNVNYFTWMLPTCGVITSMSLRLSVSHSGERRVIAKAKCANGGLLSGRLALVSSGVLDPEMAFGIWRELVGGVKYLSTRDAVENLSGLMKGVALLNALSDSLTYDVVA